MTADSSVVIAAFSSWSEQHDAAVQALADNDVRDLVAHAELESYSVLTRLPEPFRATPALVAQYLREDYPGARLALPEQALRGLIERLAALSISGGAAYDAMTALTAAHHGHALLTCDRRAAPVYGRLDVEAIHL